MKVCFVGSNYPPEAYGGTEQVLRALAAHLRGHGVDTAVVATSDRPHEGVDRRDETLDGTPVTRLYRHRDEYDRHGFVRPRLLARLGERLRELSPDLVHVHSFAGVGTGTGALCRELGVPLVISCHDLWTTCARAFRIPAGGVSCPPDADRTPCVTCVNDALQTDPAVVAAALRERDAAVSAEFAAAAAVTTPSATAARFVRDCVPHAGPIDVIPHGLLRAVPAAERTPPPADGERLRVGTFGGLVEQKGVRELVQAVAGLPCELHLSGPFHVAAFGDEVRALCARQGTPLVHRGRYGADDRHPARDLHLAVFPSKCQETYCLVVDEALAHGVPTVVSDAGALAERGRTGGVVVTPLADLAAVLRRLVTSRDRLAALRQAIPAELPTIAVSARRHLELYRRLVSA